MLEDCSPSAFAYSISKNLCEKQRWTFLTSCEYIRQVQPVCVYWMRTHSSQVGVIFLQALNHFQRYAYVRQAYARESRAKEGANANANHLVPPPPLASRTPSNRSEISLGGL